MIGEEQHESGKRARVMGFDEPVEDTEMIASFMEIKDGQMISAILAALGELTVGTPAVGAYRIKWERGGHRSQMHYGAP